MFHFYAEPHLDAEKHSKSKYAFQLAEEYRDFRSLVDLCNSTPPIYPSSSNVNSGRIQRYIEKYKEEFTDELYLWYIEHGKVYFFHEIEWVLN